MNKQIRNIYGILCLSYTLPLVKVRLHRNPPIVLREPATNSSVDER